MTTAIASVMSGTSSRLATNKINPIKNTSTMEEPIKSTKLIDMFLWHSRIPPHLGQTKSVSVGLFARIHPSSKKQKKQGTGHHGTKLSPRWQKRGLTEPKVALLKFDDDRIATTEVSQMDRSKHEARMR
ncbi:MAG: hypothetical protein Q8Q28_13620, partial [Pseudomonadota bacterium]|nr:hypothetical protein [Pseudomonadota bacterium]